MCQFEIKPFVPILRESGFLRMPLLDSPDYFKRIVRNITGQEAGRIDVFGKVRDLGGREIGEVHGRTVWER